MHAGGEEERDIGNTTSNISLGSSTYNVMRFDHQFFTCNWWERSILELSYQFRGNSAGSLFPSSSREDLRFWVKPYHAEDLLSLNYTHDVLFSNYGERLEKKELRWRNGLIKPPGIRESRQSSKFKSGRRRRSGCRGAELRTLSWRRREVPVGSKEVTVFRGLISNSERTTARDKPKFPLGYGRVCTHTCMYAGKIPRESSERISANFPPRRWAH